MNTDRSTCGASVAKSDGSHAPCVLPSDHVVDCLPGPAPGCSEAAFVGHLLALVEQAGAALTFVDAINVARSLLLARRRGLPR